ncbi:TPA: hypothetical protein ACKQWI_000290 [Streptococcus pyogenes]
MKRYEVTVNGQVYEVSLRELVDGETVEVSQPAAPATEKEMNANAAGDRPNSQFKVKRILKRNPEAITVSLIASSIAAGVYPESQFRVTSIYCKR